MNWLTQVMQWNSHWGGYDKGNCPRSNLELVIRRKGQNKAVQRVQSSLSERELFRNIMQSPYQSPIGVLAGFITFVYLKYKRFLTDSAQQLAPQTPTIFQFPRTYYFVQISRPAKICPKNRYFEEHINRLPLYRLIFVIVVYVIVQTANRVTFAKVS